MKSVIFAILLILEARAAEQSNIIGKFDNIMTVCEEIKKYRDNGEKVVLALGALPTEFDHFKFDTSNGFEKRPAFIYLDNGGWTTPPEGIETIKRTHSNFFHLDFNSTFDLFCLQKRLEKCFGIKDGCFDLIIPDFSVGKFMNLNASSLNEYLKLLTVDGQMIFDYNTCLAVRYKNEEELMQKEAERLNSDVSRLMQRAWRFLIQPDVSSLSSAYTDADGLKQLENIYNEHVDRFHRTNMPGNCTLSTRRGIFPYWTSEREDMQVKWSINQEEDYYLVLTRTR